jgi:hypothetical protein
MVDVLIANDQLIEQFRVGISHGDVGLSDSPGTARPARPARRRPVAIPESEDVIATQLNTTRPPPADRLEGHMGGRGHRWPVRSARRRIPAGPG